MKKAILVILVAALFLAVGTSCSKPEKPQTPVPPATPVKTVEASPLSTGIPEPPPEDPLAQRLDPSDSDKARSAELTEKAMKILLQDRPTEAIKLFDEALHLDPKNQRAHSGRGQAFLFQKHFDRAFDDFEICLKEDPNNFQLLINRAMCHFGWFKFDKALEDVEKAIKLEPDNALGYYNRGKIYNATHKYEKALVEFEKTLKIDPKLPEAYHQRAWALAKLDRLDEAKKDLTKSRKMDPTSIGTMVQMGQLYSDLGDKDKAIEYYTKAINEDPEFNKDLRFPDPSNTTNCYGNRGSIYVDKGMIKEALADLNKGLELRPQDKYLNVERGYIYMQMGQPDKARADAKVWLDSKPKLDSYEKYIYTGSAYIIMGEYDKAIEMINKGIGEEEDRKQFHLERGLAYWKKGEKDKARADFKIVLSQVKDEDARDRAKEFMQKMDSE